MSPQKGSFEQLQLNKRTEACVLLLVDVGGIEVASNVFSV